MTATLEDRAAPEDEARAPVEDAPPPPPPPRTLMLAEAALIGVSLATVIGYARLFADGAFLVPIAARRGGGPSRGHRPAPGRCRPPAVDHRPPGPAPARAHLGPLLGDQCPPPAHRADHRHGERRPGRGLGRSSSTSPPRCRPLPGSSPWPWSPPGSWPWPPTAWPFAWTPPSRPWPPPPACSCSRPILAERGAPDDLRRCSSSSPSWSSSLASRVARADGTGRWLATDAGRGARSLLAAGLLLAGLAVIPAVIAGPRLPGGDGRPAGRPRRRWGRQRPGDPQSPGRHPVPPGRAVDGRGLPGRGRGPVLLADSPRSTPSTARSGRPRATTSGSTAACRRPPTPLPGRPGSASTSASAPSTRSGSPPRSSPSRSTARTPTWTGTVTRPRWSSAPAGRPPTVSSTTCCRSCPASIPMTSRSAPPGWTPSSWPASPACPRPPARSPVASRRRP